MKRIVVAVALALSAVSTVAQQSVPPAGMGEVINVEITNLDVVVTDSKGNRVTGLTRDDFEIFENGKKQEVTNLSEISRTSSASTTTIQPAPRRILLIVDNASIAFTARKKVFDATRAAIEKLIVGPSDRMAVATLSNSVQQRLGWTADKDEVLKTIAVMEKDAILPRAEYIELERTIGAILDDANAIASGMTGELRGASDRPDAPPSQGRGNISSVKTRPGVDFQQLITAGRNYAANATTDTKRTLSALNAAITSFAAIPGGRKIVILVGGGLPLNAADAPFQRIENVRQTLELGNHPAVSGQRTASTLTQISAYDVTPQLDAVAVNAKLKGVAIYSVNPEFGDRKSAGVTSRTSFDQNAEFALMKGMLDGYQRLALLTGGAAMIGRPADQVITEIVNDLDSYYSLAYRANGPLNPKSRIEVKVKKGLTARSTLASGAISRDWEVADQVLANLVMEPTNPLSISVVMDPAVVDGDKKTIPMKVMIPVNSLKLVQDGSEYAASFAIFISLGDAGGNGSDPSRQEQSFRWPESAVAQVKGKTIGFAVNLEVGADRDRVSVGVLDQYSGTAGYTRAKLE
ncbi:MAG: VWA domain-containing protein [Thermoanaerobaculia bacterium]